MMTIREQAAIEGLKAEREKLRAINKADLSDGALAKWYAQGNSAFRRAESILGTNAIAFSVPGMISGFELVSDLEVLDDVRDAVIGKLDRFIEAIDQKQIVLPVLDGLILKIKDTKLSTLLNEFNAAKDKQPNLAAIALRTILSLVIRERAKLVDAASTLATKQDLVLEKDIKAALAAKIFPDGEARRLTRFLGGGHKDTCDIVAHKAGDSALVNKDDLADNVDLLNKLLATIT